MSRNKGIEKDVVNVLSFRERWRNEDLLEGEAIGEARGVNKLAELIREGLSLEDALKVIESEATGQTSATG